MTDKLTQELVDESKPLSVWKSLSSSRAARRARVIVREIVKERGNHRDCDRSLWLPFGVKIGVPSDLDIGVLFAFLQHARFHQF